MNILKAVNLRKIYGQGETEVDDIRLAIRRALSTLFTKK